LRALALPAVARWWWTGLPNLESQTDVTLFAENFRYV
jgi:hypothetical protein